MKTAIMTMIAVVVSALPVLGAKTVYLKDGSIIQATSAWREGSMINVLVNRNTLATFNREEVDIKRTFPQKVKKPLRKRVAKPVHKQAAMPEQAMHAGAAKTGSETKQKTLSLPSLPEKSPDTFKSKEEGAIRRHKREMAERAAE